MSSVPRNPRTAKALARAASFRIWDRFKAYRDKVRALFPQWRRLPCDRTIRCFIFIWYDGRAVCHRPDPDHVYSAILDCLFADDSMVIGGIAGFDVDANNPRVQIRLEVPCPQP